MHMRPSYQRDEEKRERMDRQTAFQLYIVDWQNLNDDNFVWLNEYYVI